jgi:hypothetical protein
MKLFAGIVFVLAGDVAIALGIEPADRFMPFPQEQPEPTPEYQEPEYEFEPYPDDADDYPDEP